MAIIFVGQAASARVAAGRRRIGARTIKCRQIIKVAQTRLDVLYVNLHVIAQRGQIRFVQRVAQIIQRVVQSLQLVSVTFTFREALSKTTKYPITAMFTTRLE